MCHQAVLMHGSVYAFAMRCTSVAEGPLRSAVLRP
jgi:hypothetical protein